MSFQNFKTNTYCVGGRHKSGTKNIDGVITLNKKTGKEFKLLVGKCAICDKRKSLVVSDNVIQAEGLIDFFKNLGESSVKVGKKLATNVLINRSRAVDITANIATAAASRSPKKVVSILSEVIIFYHTGKSLYLPGFKQFYTI